MEAALEVLGCSFPGCPAFCAQAHGSSLLLQGEMAAASVLGATPALVGPQEGLGSRQGAEPARQSFRALLCSRCSMTPARKPADEEVDWQKEEFHAEATWRQKPQLR